MRKVIPDELKEPLEQGRLLFISTSKAVRQSKQTALDRSKAVRQSKQTALDRNKYICEVADNIFFVGVTPNSSLYPLKEYYGSKKGRASLRTPTNLRITKTYYFVSSRIKNILSSML